MFSEPEEWPENIRTKATKESHAEANNVRELFQLAAEQEPDAFSDLIGLRSDCMDGTPNVYMDREVWL